MIYYTVRGDKDMTVISYYIVLEGFPSYQYTNVYYTKDVGEVLGKLSGDSKYVRLHEYASTKTPDGKKYGHLTVV